MANGSQGIYHRHHYPDDCGMLCDKGMALKIALPARILYNCSETLALGAASCWFCPETLGVERCWFCAEILGVGR